MGLDYHTLGYTGNILLLWANEWSLLRDLIIPRKLMQLFLYNFLSQAVRIQNHHAATHFWHCIKQKNAPWQIFHGCFLWDCILDRCQKWQDTHVKYSFENLSMPIPKSTINGKAANLLACVYIAPEWQLVVSELLGLPPQSSQHHYN